MFKAYDRDESYQIDDLTIENQADVINIYGNLQLYHDEHSLKQAQQLLKILQDTVHYLEDLQQQKQLSKKTILVSNRWIDNPFES